MERLPDFETKFVSELVVVSLCDNERFRVADIDTDARSVADGVGDRSPEGDLVVETVFDADHFADGDFEMDSDCDLGTLWVTDVLIDNVFDGSFDKESDAETVGVTDPTIDAETDADNVDAGVSLPDFVEVMCIVGVWELLLV